MAQAEPFPFEFSDEVHQWVGALMDWVFEPNSDQSYGENPWSQPEEWNWSMALGEALLNHLPKLPPKKMMELEQGKTIHSRLENTLLRLAEWYLRLLVDAAAEGDVALELIVAEQAARLYQSTYGRRLPMTEGPLLQSLSWNRNEHGIRLLVELLVALPPHDWSASAVAISPLMRSTTWKTENVFPRLFDALQHPTVIAPLLDLANFVTRKEMVPIHPAIDRKHVLLGLLGGVVSRMGILEEKPTSFGTTVEEIQHVLGESVALCVSLCDAVGLIGDTEAIPKLNQAMELRHRRIQTEAASALAKLGDPVGKQSLLRFAADPSTRLRVLQYARELGIESEVDESWQTPVAIAESELAIWLSQPPQMGLPPTDMELVCQKTLYWPGYDEPQECFLFRYSYRFPESELSNIGIAGPIVHSFAADLGDLPEDDIFAAFAGWCAEHHDIYEVEVHHFNPAQQNEAQRLCDHMDREGYEGVRPKFMGFFVGERALVVEASRGDVKGVGVTDGLETLWIPTERSLRPLKANDVYMIYKGRKILRTFND